jgi:hypothetical protein
MSHTIRISDETYEHVITEAAKSGVEPDVWAEKKLKPVKKKKVSERARQKAWDNYIGMFDSSKTDKADKTVPLDKRIKQVFGEAVEEKMKRAGFKIHK